MKLTPRDLETLNELQGANDGRYSTGWDIPLDFGGFNGSHHSSTLRKLERYGLVESKQRGGWTGMYGSRGSKKYRITDAGRAQVGVYLEARRAAKEVKA